MKLNIFVVTSLWQLWESIVNSCAVTKHRCKPSPYTYISRWMNWHNSSHFPLHIALFFSQTNVKILIAKVFFRVLYYFVLLVNLLVCNETCRKMNTLIITWFKSNFLLKSLREILSWLNSCNCTEITICPFIYKYIDSPDSLTCVMLLSIVLAVWRRNFWDTWFKCKTKVKKKLKINSLIDSKTGVS